MLILRIKKVLGKVGWKLQNDLFDLKISIKGIWKVLLRNVGFVVPHFEYKESFWAILGKNYRMIHLTWKFLFRVFERCSFLIWLLILLVLCIYFIWKNTFCGQNLSNRMLYPMSELRNSGFSFSFFHFSFSELHDSKI